MKNEPGEGERGQKEGKIITMMIMKRTAKQRESFWDEQSLRKRAFVRWQVKPVEHDYCGARLRVMKRKKKKKERTKKKKNNGETSLLLIAPKY
jgi:hypothetical protein